MGTSRTSSRIRNAFWLGVKLGILGGAIAVGRKFNRDLEHIAERVIGYDYDPDPPAVPVPYSPFSRAS